MTTLYHNQTTFYIVHCDGTAEALDDYVELVFRRNKAVAQNNSGMYFAVVITQSLVHNCEQVEVGNFCTADPKLICEIDTKVRTGRVYRLRIIDGKIRIASEELVK